jgi:GrpB-like predicted nucleotidyltransferase (UPF0157 family)/inorganic pyrophosphatase
MIEPNYDWSKKFQTEKEKLREIFGSAALNIEHIGSTAVEGLLSKPIVDIAVMIENHKDADAFTELVAQIGYTFHSLSTERHFYTKGNPVEYHVSIAYADQGGFWERQILFRDYLRTHPETRDEYAKLKEDFLRKDPTGGDEYIEGKSEFIKNILHLTKEEKIMNNTSAKPTEYLDKTVTIKIDRKLGSKHPKHGFVYELNYGFVPDTVAPDGEELDAYLLGVDTPVETFTGRCIAVIHRTNDDDDKLIVVPEGKDFSDDEIRTQTHFQEQFFKSEIVRNKI